MTVAIPEWIGRQKGDPVADVMIMKLLSDSARGAQLQSNCCETANVQLKVFVDTL